MKSSGNEDVYAFSSEVWIHHHNIEDLLNRITLLVE
jgi:hypothetical protein